MNAYVLKLSAWWRSLGARDQRIVLIGLSLAVPMLLYLAIWQPISSAQNKAVQAERAMQQQLDEARQLAAQLRARPNSGALSTNTPRLAPLPAIEAAARQFALSDTLKRREAEGAGGVRVVFEAVSAEALLKMLETLALQHGLQVSSAQIDPVSPGRVNAQISLKSGAS